ncbi:MAG: metallophosphoesterase [Burkholderiales bacterium]|jgi:hypothetical protein|nr:metallophosphoesterase [Burkholderiales bacterium]
MANKEKQHKPLISFPDATRLNDNARFFLEPKDAQCHPEKQIPGVILFPALGTPLIYDGKKTTISIYVVMDACATDSFHRSSMDDLENRVSVSSELKKAYSRSKWFQGDRDDVWYCPMGYLFVSQHLRLVSMDAATHKGTNEVIGWEKGRLNEKDQYAAEGMKHICVWRIGQFRPGNLRNKEGKIVGTLDTKTVAHYKKLAGEFGFTLSDVFEIEIDAHWLGVNSTAKSLAWLYSPPESLKAAAFYPPWLRDNKFQSIELQDLMLNRAFMEQSNDLEKMYYKKLGEADKNMRQLMASSVAVTSNLLSWHPVKMINILPEMIIAQISDIHLNQRHYTIARSQVALLDGAPGPLGKPFADKLCNPYMAMRELIDAAADGDPAKKIPKAHVLMITGDMHDNNRSLVPEAVNPPGSGLPSIAAIWKACNIFDGLMKLEKSPYLRGPDHILMYTAILDAYREKNLPCFVINGNHEPYRMQYGVSPRAVPFKSRSFWIGLWERAKRLSENLSDRALRKSIADKYFFSPKGADKFGEWYPRKGDEGIPGDHNLTPYELCLAFGPTYAQVLTGFNFHEDWFDWVHYLLTPWQNWYFEHNGSPYVGLGWGEKENFVNLADIVSKSDREQQGDAFLSRAPKTIDWDQKALIEQGQDYKERNLFLFTHFTMVNLHPEVAFFKPPKDYNAPSKVVNNLSFFPVFDDLSIIPSVGWNVNQAGWNKVNWGTCEKNLPWFFENCVNFDNKAGANPNAITAHFVGHSHRPGVYNLIKCEDETRFEILKFHWFRGSVLEINDACDPGLCATKVATTPSPNVTKFVVCSSSGIMGKQNIWDELAGWTWVKPSGIVYNGGVVSTIETKGNKPRMCVCADYLPFVKHEGKDANKNVIPISWKMHSIGKDHVKFKLRIHPLLVAMDCIESVNLWKYDGDQWVQGKKPCVLKGADFSTEKDSDCVALKRPSEARIYTMEVENSLLLKGMSGDSTTKEKNSSNAAEQPAGLSKGEKRNKKPDKVEIDKTNWFCEVKFKAPEGYGGVFKNLFDVSDSWVFPVGVRTESDTPDGLTIAACGIARPNGELGEVPDWEWLHKLNGAKYPKPTDVIFPNQASSGGGGGGGR